MNCVSSREFCQIKESTNILDKYKIIGTLYLYAKYKRHDDDDDDDDELKHK